MKEGIDHFIEGVESRYPLCCVLFFCGSWESLLKNIPEFKEDMPIMENNERVMCPRCIMESLGDFD